MTDYWDDPTEVGVGGTANLPATNELPVDMHRKIMTAFPSVIPMLSIFTRLSSDPATNFRIDWQEENEIATKLVVSTTEASAGTSITVAANALTAVDDSLLFNPRTYDLRRVNAAPTTATALTVAISQGGTTSAVWKSGDVIYVLPPAIPENDATYRAVSVADSNVYNYVHLVKMNFSITRLMNAMKTHFGGRGSKRQQLKRQKFREFSKKLEHLIYMGGRASSGSAPATQYMAGGLVHYLRNGTLWKDFGGILTESGFRNYIGDYKDQNPDATNIACFCAGGVIDIIDGWGLNKIRLSPKSKTLGLDVNTYRSRGISVDLISLPLLTDPICRGWGFLLDLERIKLRYVDRPKFYPEALSVGESEVIYDTYRTVISLLIANESRHSMFIGALV